MAKEFDPSQWRQKKYGNQELSFLGSGEYQAELELIVGAIHTVLHEAQIEFREDLSTTYDIVGAVIYGSFARGDVHTQSDLDLCVIATQEPHGLVSDFVARLEEHGVRRHIASEDVMAILVGENETETRRWLTRGILNMVGRNRIIVCPDPNVCRLMERVLRG